MSEREIFDAALAIADPVQRTAYLDRACGDDAGLREQVEGLLEMQGRLGSFLEFPAGGLPYATFARPLREGPGTIIGPYKLLQQIGEGGMGVVFLAEQTHPVQRRVALKVIKAGMDTRQVIARFEAERQALAMMDHINIARVLDAGATESGRPYFVMELVHGVPITRYCDDNRLSPRQRLELFVPVCQAIQHAHQKGIIHRDIKPSNVMITLYDGKPVPKVIDFGVAKATEQRLTERTLFTQYGSMVGTLEYMAPEQAEMSALGADTRSDIFSLGVLLYELLTGSTPLTHKRLKDAAYGEILRIIQEEEPPKPSTRLRDSGEALESISAQRQMEPTKLTKMVRGELDWIVMKTLEKDRARRYETANGLAADVRRYLADEPVQACPPSATYRLRKFVRRNKGPALAVTIIFLLLLGGIIGTTRGLVRALSAEGLAGERLKRAEKAEGLARNEAKTAREREAESRAVLDFVESKVFATARPKDQRGGLGHDVQLRKAVEAALPFVDQSFANQPLIEARLRWTLGVSFLFLGEARIAAEQFQTARALYTKHRGPEHPETLKMMSNLANSYDALGQHDDALKLREETLALFKARFGPDHPDTLGSMNNLATSYSALGRHAEAFKLLEETLARYKAKLGPDHPGTLSTMSNLAGSYEALGRHRDALKLLEETLALRKIKLGPDHPDTLSSMDHLAAGYHALGRGADAHKLCEETLALRNVKLGPEHPDTLRNMWGLAESLLELDRGAQAVPVIDECLRRAAGKAVHSQLIETLMDLRLMHFRRSNDAAGCRATAEMWEKLGRTDADSLYRAARMRAATAAAVARDSRIPGANATRLADEETERALSWLAQSVAAEPKSYAYSLIGDLLRDRKDYDGADAAYRKAIGIDPKSVYGHARLGTLLKDTDLDGAIVEFRTLTALDSKSSWAQGELGSALCERGDFAAGAAALRKAIELNPDGVWQWYQLADAYLVLGQRESHQKLCSEMMKRYEASKDPYWANRILYACLPSADSLADVSPLIALAEVAAGGKSDERALGAALYRNRKYDQAIARLTQATQDRAWDHFFLAMAHHHLGNAGKAGEHLGIAVQRLEKSDYPWTERIESQTLRREAETLIKEADTDPGQKKK
jgi:serine/threonine protein kinase/tetratricopeptide (TPR) repeat protein